MDLIAYFIAEQTLEELEEYVTEGGYHNITVFLRWASINGLATYEEDLDSWTSLTPPETLFGWLILCEEH